MKRAVLIVFLLGAASWAAGAEAPVAAPALVDEDLPDGEPARPARPATRLPAPEPPPRRRASPPPSPEPAAAQADAEPLVRPIEPVRARPEDLLAAWQERRVALREQDPRRTRAAEARLLELKAELGLENLDDYAAAEVRAARRALEASRVAEAIPRAELAVKLAPDLAGAHLALARARLAADPAQPAAASSAARAGLAALLRAPDTARALLADVLAAALLAAGITAALTVSLLLARRLRAVVHDFRHLPLVRHATPLQATFLALVVLVAPFALRLGPAAALGVVALAAALHLGARERVVASAALVALALMPWGAEVAARLTAWPGTLAADVYEIEHGGGDAAPVARLEALAARGELPAPALLALGRHHKRRGHLDQALGFYRAAGAARPEALVGIGNVRLLQGDADGAKAAYLAAVDAATARRDPTALAAAHYDLSKVLLRQSALDQSQRARDSAAAEDAALLARYGSDEDFRANRWLIDVPVPPADLRALADDDAPVAVREAVRARLAGPLPRAAWPWAPLAAAAAVALLALVRRRASPSHACDRCGRPVCRRCDAVSGSLCGQCVNVFLKRAVVDPRDRTRKELQVQRHAVARRRVVRLLAVLCCGAGHLWRGEAARGALVALLTAFLVALGATWTGLVPVRHPTPWLAAAKAALTAPLALGLWALAARDVFRRTRS